MSKPTDKEKEKEKDRLDKSSTLSQRLRELVLRDAVMLRSLTGRVTSDKATLSPLPDSLQVDADLLGLRKAAYIESFDPGYVKMVPLENTHGHAACWRVGLQSADDYMRHADVAGLDAKLVRTPHVRVFFPVRGEYFLMRTFDLPPGTGNAPTLRAVLRAVEVVALGAASHHLHTAGPKETQLTRVTVGDARRWLRGSTVCHLLCRRTGGGNHVYVRTTDDAA